MKKILTYLGLISLLGLSTVDAKHVKIYLLTGQSNSLGTTADKSEKDPANPPKSYRDKEIPFFWSNMSTRAGDGPATLIGSSDGKITTLQKQQGEGANTSFWGPEISFGRAIHKAGEKDFLIVKASRGGGGNGYWLEGKQMHKHVLTTATTATAELDKLGHTYEFATLLYLQGESNNAAEAKVAGQRFSELLDRLRTQLPNAKDMNAVIGGIAAARTTMDLTRAQHKDLAKSREDIAYFSNLDLQDQLYDRLHFDKKAKLKIGKRFAKEVLKINK